MKMIYTDGACKGNPGVGGYGVVIKEDGKPDQEYSFYGGKMTTNIRMEMSAVIKGLTYIQPGETATLFTDSQFTVNGITNWINGWKKNGWVTGRNKQAVKNKDLWEEMDSLVQDRNVTFKFVRGHNGDPGNERADQLANIGCMNSNS